MSWTKRQIVVQAYEELGLSSSVFELSPEQLASALRKLDAMMAAWSYRGIRVGYAGCSTPEPDGISDDSGLPDGAVEAVYQSLAIQLAPGVGKTVPIELKENAKNGYRTLLARAAVPPEIQLPPGVPAGAGYKRVKSTPFLDNPVDNLEAGPDGDLDFE
jgi:hypothetical protein